MEGYTEGFEVMDQSLRYLYLALEMRLNRQANAQAIKRQIWKAGKVS